jgi:hypothetical protein
MKPANILFASAALILSAGVAQAGLCNSANKDAGSGPTAGHTATTTGAAPSRTDEHPPTSTMNKAVGNTATSSQDAQRQMQGQPTAAQAGQGEKSAAADKDC